MRLAILASVAAASASWAPAAAEPDSRPDPAALAPEPPREPYSSLEHFRLANGLAVVLCRMDTPLVTVTASYRVGSAQDPPQRSGLAHLVEHLAFRGSRHVPATQRDRALAAAKALEHSGGTDWEWTEYWTTLSPANVEVALWIEADRMGFLAPALDKKTLEIERAVVIQERHERVDDVLESRAHEEVFTALFPPSHPYHQPVAGTLAGLKAIELGDARAFVERWYRPSNAVLTVIGRFDAVKVRGLVERYFATLPQTAAPERPPVPALAAVDAQVRRADAPEPAARAHVAWPIPALFAPGDAAAALVGHLVTNRLERRANAGAVDGSVWYIGLGGQGVLIVSLTAPPGTTPETLLGYLDAELDDLAKAPPTALELARARALLETSFFTGVDGIAGLAEWARVLRDYVFYLGDAGRLTWDLERHRRVSAAEVSRFVAGVLRPERRVALLTPARRAGGQDPG